MLYYFVTHLLNATNICPNHFPLSSIFTLNRLKQGVLDYLKALKVLQRASKISDDILIMADKMYLQQSKKHGFEQVAVCFLF